jgi:hypothetical protein
VQSDLFYKDKTTDEIRIEEAKNILLEAGYAIIEPYEMIEKVNNMRELCDYFYKRLWDKYPERRQYYSYNKIRDMNIIKKFVESRKNGMNEKQAIQECVLIIDIIFDNEQEFNFKTPILDVTILGQNKSRWITEKALFMLMKKKKDNKSSMIDKKIAEAESQSIDLKKKGKELERMLNNINNNGEL